MGYSRNVALVGLMWVLSLGAANAQCRVCDEVVELDQTLASCYVRQFDAIERAVSVAPNGRLKIDLSGCKGVQTDGERGGLLSMPSLTAPARRLKSVFILDLAYAQCLRDLLVGVEGPIDPTVEFDLFVQCQS